MKEKLTEFMWLPFPAETGKRTAGFSVLSNSVNAHCIYAQSVIYNQLKQKSRRLYLAYTHNRTLMDWNTWVRMCVLKRLLVVEFNVEYIKTKL